MYPRSIEEAAKKLDQVTPDWFTKINLARLKMDNSLHCVLGQVYGNDNVGAEKLFGKDNDYKYEDRIFGWRADVGVWKLQINSRLVDVHDFKWAKLHVEEGDVVKRPKWYSNWDLTTQSKLFFSMEDILATDYFIVVPTVTLATIKNGQRFKIKPIHGWGNREYIKNAQHHSLNGSTFTSLDTGVIFVKQSKEAQQLEVELISE